MKICPRCGMGYPDSDRFCMECGSRLGGAAERPRPGKLKIPRGVEEGISQLQGRLRMVEDELGRLDKELRDLKAAQPEDTELLKSAAEGSAKRISRINSRLNDISRGVERNEKHIEGIEGVLGNFAKRRDIEDLRKEISAGFAQGTREENERFEALETEARSELNRLNQEFTKDLRIKLGTGLKKVERLEAELAILISGLEKTTTKRLEDFKTGFNRRVNGAILELRKEVAQRTNIINELRGNLTDQIRLNEKRYSDFEGRLKGELESINNLKEGLAVQQQDRLKEFQTLILERIGEMKENSESMGKELKGLVCEEIGKRFGEGLREECSGIISELGEGVKEEIKKNARDIGRLKKLEEDLVLHQQGRMAALDERLGRELEGIRQESQAFVSGLEERLRKGMRLGTGEIRALRGSLGRDFVKRKELADIDRKLREMGALRERVGRGVGDLKKLEEDLVLHQQGRMVAMESGVNRSIKGLGVKAEKAIRDATGKAREDMEKRLREIRGFDRRLERISATERGIARRVSELKRLEGRISGFVKREELEGLEKNIRGFESGLRSARGLAKGLEANAREIKKLGKGLRDLETKAGKGMGRDLEERFDALEGFRQEGRQQMGLLKEFMENLEKRMSLEVGSLEKKLDEISRIQEKQELEILTPKRENINRVIKTQVKNEVRGLEDRISRRILKRLGPG